MDRQEAIKVVMDNWPEGRVLLKSALEILIPELCESEDEKIRKELIRAFTVTADKRDYEIYGNGITYGQVLAWLEKQGEKNPVPNWMPKFLDELRSKKNYFDWDENKEIEGHILAIIQWMNPNYFNEKQGKQKPTNKVESKFKVWDWIVQEGVGTYKVVEVCKWYEVIGIDGNQYSISFIQENDYHLWSIKDAKDGDVLVAGISEEPNDFIYIFKKYDKDLGFWSHCYLDAYTNKFHKGIYHNNHNVGVPATKEQRELLFSKMKEAGYEWDAENKKLKQIEQKASIDLSDLKTWKYIVDAVLTKEHGIGQYLDNGRIEIMAKELQDRFGNMAKAAWSEEDELNLNQAIYVCHQHGYSGVETWLKFFKERIKGEKS